MFEDDLKRLTLVETERRKLGKFGQAAGEACKPIFWSFYKTFGNSEFSAEGTLTSDLQYPTSVQIQGDKYNKT